MLLVGFFGCFGSGLCGVLCDLFWMRMGYVFSMSVFDDCEFDFFI